MERSLKGSTVIIFLIIFNLFFRLYTGNAMAAEDVNLPSTDNSETVWSCVYFGSYPQTEIFDMNLISHRIDKKYAKGEFDYYEVDRNLYQKLCNADYDSNEDTIIDGEKYRRVKNSDVKPRYNGYYYSDRPYHYFRYEKIKWRVLEIENGTALLLADKVLDAKKYNNKESSLYYDNPKVSWERSTVRSWINGYDAGENDNEVDFSSDNFINSAFSSDEYDAIRTADLKNDDNTRYYVSEGGNNTKDRVFLLSLSDVFDTDKSVSHGFVKDGDTASNTRSAKSTTYAKALGVESEKVGSDSEGCCNWWLRSPGDCSFEQNNVAYVPSRGYVYSGGAAHTVISGIRPALYMDLSSDSWSSAGIVNDHFGTNVKSNNGDENRIMLFSVNISNLKNKTYTGRSIQQKIVVIDDSKTLREGTDYTVAYMNNKNVGNATVTVTGVGNYTGSVNVKFYIIPAGTDIKKLSKGKKCFIVKWKKQSAKMSKSRISGYKIRYSRKSSMKGAKTKTVKGYKKTSRKITGLSKKKKYYVQVRTYKKIGSYVYYSNWSKAKTVKTS